MGDLMASAYKLDIDTSDLERASKLFSGIQSGLYGLKDKLYDIASLGGLLTPVFDEIKNIADDTKDILEDWSDSLDSVTSKMGKILSLIRNMAMTPINLFADALDFFNDISEGGQTRSRNAKPLGTSADKLLALEKAEKIMDTGGAFITMMEALSRSLGTQQGMQSFAQLGFTQDKAIEQFKSGQGIEFLFDFLEQINNQIAARGGQFTPATKETMNDALGNILGLDIESFLSQYSDLNKINREYKEQYKNIKGTSGSLKKMRENTNRLSETFNTLKISIANELYPIFDDLAQEVQKNLLPLFNEFKKSGMYKELQDLAKQASGKVKEYMDDPNLIKNLIKKIDSGFDIFKDVVFALMNAISYLPGAGDLKKYLQEENNKKINSAIGNFNSFLGSQGINVDLKNHDYNDPNSFLGLGPNKKDIYTMVDDEQIRNFLNNLAGDTLLDEKNNAIGGRKNNNILYNNLSRFAEQWAKLSSQGQNKDISLDFSIRGNNLVLRLKDKYGQKLGQDFTQDIISIDRQLGVNK